ncbi:hypothetical protein BC941DRAFT_485040 [Chlamydoabsidia padenii]|nr:hypothetical protein BC941DRAFT_485040 [Chlamydoabsidia padenii]
MYHPQLEQYNPDLVSQKQIDRLSKQYNSTNAIQQLLTGSSLSISTLEQSNVKPADIDCSIRLPISPPLSPLSSNRNSTCSLTSFSSNRTSLIASSLHLSPSHSTPYTTIKPRLPSIQYDDQSSTLDQYPIIITHIHKTSRMRLRSLLGHSVVLNKTIRMDPRLYTKDPRFYLGSEEGTGQAKLVLKLTIIKSPQTVHPTLAPFGIHFANTAILPVSTNHMMKYASIPDALVLEALYAWLAHSHLPHLSHACHIMRDGIKLYIVFDPSTLL